MGTGRFWLLAYAAVADRHRQWTSLPSASLHHWLPNLQQQQLQHQAAASRQAVRLLLGSVPTRWPTIILPLSVLLSSIHQAPDRQTQTVLLLYAAAWLCCHLLTAILSAQPTLPPHGSNPTTPACIGVLHLQCQMQAAHYIPLHGGWVFTLKACIPPYPACHSLPDWLTVGNGDFSAWLPHTTWSIRALTVLSIVCVPNT